MLLPHELTHRRRNDAALALSLAVAQSLHLPSSAAAAAATSSTSASTFSKSKRRAPTFSVPGSTDSASVSSRLKTLHSVLIIHFLLSLRLDRIPLSIALLQDYEGEIPPPPTDEVENWDLWRSDKTAGELRREWATGAVAEAEEEKEEEADQLDGGDSPDAGQKKGKGPSSSSFNKQKKGGGRTAAAGGGGAGAGSAGGFQEQPALAVASNSLVVFARLAELCQIGTRILRTKLRSAAVAASVDGSQRETHDQPGRRQSADGREEEEGQDSAVSFSSEELLRQLQEWEDGLGPDLRIGTTSSSSAALVKERPRWTVAMHLVLATLRLRLIDSNAAEYVFPEPDPWLLPKYSFSKLAEVLTYTTLRPSPQSDWAAGYGADLEADYSDPRSAPRRLYAIPLPADV